MSRIVGLLQPADVTVSTATMIKALGVGARPGLTWSAQEQSLGDAEFGWWGAGHADLACGDGVLVVLDGTVYNRDEFDPTTTQSTLVARLYAAHGFPEALRRLHGDFAIALYDQRARRLWLGRDRLGVRPLYYAAAGGRAAFASRPRPLLTLPWVSREPRREFVALFAGSHYRYFDNNPEASPYRDVSQVPAGHAVCVSNEGVERVRYWTVEDAPPFTAPERELADQYQALLLDAVRRRLAGVEHPAFTLSGGLDSSSVLASAVRLTGRRQQAFSSVYADKTFDESTEIRDMLADTVERWHAVAIEPRDVFDVVRRMLDANDEPVATATWLAHFLLCDAIQATGASHVFGGLGGDELNAGEYEYFLFFFADLRAAGLEEELSGEVRQWIAHHDHPVYRKSVAVMEDGIARLVDRSRPGR